MLSQIRTKLLSESTITSLVGDRIYPHHIPQTSSLPAVSMNVISHVTDGDLSLGRSKLARIRVQIDVWSPLLSDCETIADHLITMFDGWQGAMTDVIVGESNLDAQYELWEQIEGQDNGVYHIASDFRFFVVRH